MTSPSHDAPESTQALPTGHVAALRRAWETASEPPRLDDFAPTEPASVRRIVLTDLIRVDLAHRLLVRRETVRLEDYLTRYPELSTTGVPCDLVAEELRLRREAGEEITPEHYLDRFPEHATELGRLFGTGTYTFVAPVAPVDPLAAVQLGQELDDFQLLDELGRGAFARVFLARQKSLSRLVALKVSADRGAESHVLAQLEHPHIVRVFDQRLVPEQNLRLLYMTYITGGTLASALEYLRETPPEQRTGRHYLAAIDAVLQRRGEEPPSDSSSREQLADLAWPGVVAWVGSRLAGALAHAHGKGVLHRDIKPANVLLAADGSPRLADFNVGSVGPLDGEVPVAMFGGSLGYMAPEHIDALNPDHPGRSDRVDARADIYSLAITLWEMLTGARPFDQPLPAGDRAAAFACAAEHRRCAPLPPCNLPGSAGVVAALRSALAAEPSDRPTSASAFAHDLDLCLQPRAQELLTPSPGGWRSWVRRHPVMAVIAAATVPNIFASIFNATYNRAALERLAADALPTFDFLVPVLNGIFFPLGMLAIGLSAHAVGRAARCLEQGPCPDSSQIRLLRRQCLRLGSFAASICLLVWLVASVVWPVTLDWAVRPLPVELHVHVLASLVICGLIVSAYPYFLVTALAMRALYPPLARIGGLHAEDRPDLENAHRWPSRFLVLAVAVPLLAVGLLAVLDVRDRLTVGLLSAAGVAGCGVAYALQQVIVGDLEALTRLLPGTRRD